MNFIKPGQDLHGETVRVPHELLGADPKPESQADTATARLVATVPPEQLSVQLAGTSH